MPMNEREGGGGSTRSEMGKFGNERRKHDKVGAKYEMKTDNKNKHLKRRETGMTREGTRK
jgi:hypothetical protein